MANLNPFKGMWQSLKNAKPFTGAMEKAEFPLVGPLIRGTGRALERTVGKGGIDVAGHGMNIAAAGGAAAAGLTGAVVLSEMASTPSTPVLEPPVEREPLIMTNADVSVGALNGPRRGAAPNWAQMVEMADSFQPSTMPLRK